MPDPVGLSGAEIIAHVATTEALLEGSIPPVPPAQLQSILAKLRKDLTEKPSTP